MNKKRYQLTKSEVIDAIPLACSNELAAVEFIESQRWASITTSAKNICTVVLLAEILNKVILWQNIWKLKMQRSQMVC